MICRRKDSRNTVTGVGHVIWVMAPARRKVQESCDEPSMDMLGLDTFRVLESRRQQGIAEVGD